MELDYLAPFLARIGDPSLMNDEVAKQLKDDCLDDLKQRLIDMANLIQGRFENVSYLLLKIAIWLNLVYSTLTSWSPQETKQLQCKQNWYQQNQTTMTKEQEEEYVSYCSEAMFRIHILEERLIR